jgi:hypothetical protein
MRKGHTAAGVDLLHEQFRVAACCGRAGELGGAAKVLAFFKEGAGTIHVGARDPAGAGRIKLAVADSADRQQRELLSRSATQPPYLRRAL